LETTSVLKNSSKGTTAMLGGGIAAALLVAAAAQAFAAGEEPGRYTMTPVEGGFARLDRETGAMSICTGKEGDWTCKPVAEAQREMQARIEQLERENKTLKTEKQAPAEPPLSSPEGAPMPGDAAPHADSEPPVPPGDLDMPTEKDVDKLFDYVEGMVKKFKERIDRLEKEAKKKEETPL
jgi:uncharacterized protein (UPF0335 family)